VLPAVTVLAVLGHVAIARRHTPGTWSQGLRDAFVMAIVFAFLIGYVVSQHGADLAAPADPSAAYDARPLWYFRWLFELRHLAGSFEQFAALAAPAVVAGLLVMIPLLDRDASASARKRMPFIAAVGGLLAVIGALT